MCGLRGISPIFKEQNISPDMVFPSVVFWFSVQSQTRMWDRRRSM